MLIATDKPHVYKTWDTQVRLKASRDLASDCMAVKSAVGLRCQCDSMIKFLLIDESNSSYGVTFP